MFWYQNILFIFMIEMLIVMYERLSAILKLLLFYAIIFITIAHSFTQLFQKKTQFLNANIF